MSQFLNTYIHITGITDTSFTLGDPTPDSNGIDILKDGSTYSYITNNGATFEVGTGKFTSATRSLSRDIAESSSIDNQPIGWPAGTVLRLTVPPISGDTGSSDGGGSGSDITVIDDLGSSRMDAISQRAASDAIKQRVASIDGDLGIASMQLDGEGNIIVTDKQGGQHNVSLSAVSGDGAKDGDALAKTLNLYIGKDGSILLLDSSGKLWSIPDVSSMTKAIADAGSGSTNTTYATITLENVTDGTFQARKLSANQVISALGFTPLGSDTDLAAYAKKDFSNVDPSTIQAMEFVSKQITDALGYTPAKQIDANGLALTDLSNVSGDSIIKQLGYTPADSSKTPTTTSITTIDIGTDSATLVAVDKNKVSHTIGGGSGSTTNNAGGNPQNTSISGYNPDAGSQSVQRLVMKYGTFPTNNNLGVRVYYNGSATIDLASLGDVDSKITSRIVQSVGTSTTNTLSQKAISDNYALKTSIPSTSSFLGNVGSTANSPVSMALLLNSDGGDGTTSDGLAVAYLNILRSGGAAKIYFASQSWVKAKFSPLAIDNISGTSTTAPPSQNSVKVAVADLQSKIDALANRVATLESK